MVNIILCIITFFIIKQPKFQIKIFMFEDKQKQLGKTITNARVVEPHTAKKTSRVIVRRPEPRLSEDNPRFANTSNNSSPFQTQKYSRVATFQSRQLYCSTYIPSYKIRNPEEQGFSNRVKDSKEYNSPTKFYSPNDQKAKLILQNRELRQQVQKLKLQKLSYSSRVQQLLLQNHNLRQSSLKEHLKMKSQIQNLHVQTVYNKQLIGYFQGMIITLNSKIQELSKANANDQQLLAIREVNKNCSESLRIQIQRNRSLDIENTMLKKKQIDSENNNQFRKQLQEMSKKNRKLKREIKQMKVQLQRFMGESLQLSPQRVDI